LLPLLCDLKFAAGTSMLMRLAPRGSVVKGIVLDTCTLARLPEYSEMETDAGELSAGELSARSSFISLEEALSVTDACWSPSCCLKDTGKTENRFRIKSMSQSTLTL
jgi:hypothetical protein